MRLNPDMTGQEPNLDIAEPGQCSCDCSSMNNYGASQDVKAKSNIYFAMKIYGIVLFVLSLVITVIIAIYTMSANNGTGISPQVYLTNTFLQTRDAGYPQYTWYSFDPTSYVSQFYSCMKQSRIFDNICQDAYQTCVNTKYPIFSVCVTQVASLSAPQFPYDSFSDMLMSCLHKTDPTIPTYQKQLMTNCFALDQQPIVTVLQDKDSTYYLGSYNAGIFIFTAMYMLMIFLLYTIYTKAFVGESMQDRIKPSFDYPKLLSNNTDMFWWRTGFGMTLISFLISALLVAILAPFTWRTSETNPFKDHVPMSLQTATITFAFALLILYYFGMELWEKIYIKDVEEGKNLVEMRSRYTRQDMLSMHPKKLDLVMNPRQEYDKNEKFTPLLLFPWAESAVFVDALLKVGIIGLQVRYLCFHL